jgi:hypothetical protein
MTPGFSPIVNVQNGVPQALKAIKTQK